MEADNLKFINLIHVDGDDRHALIEAFLKARKAITESDRLQYGSVNVFVFGYLKPPRIEASKDGMSYKMTCPDTMLSFDYDYHHGDEILHGTHNCSMTEIIKFEKSYKRQAYLKKEKH